MTQQISQPLPKTELKEVVTSSASFPIEPEKLSEIVTGYQQRAPEKWEDLKLVSDLGGVEGISKLVRSDLTKGLSGSDIVERRIHFGTNVRPPPPTRTFCKIIWDALGDPLLRTLFVSGLVSIAINLATDDDKRFAWVDGTGMILAVVIVTLVTAINEYQKERQFQELNNKADQSKEVTYIKDGKVAKKHEGQIVVGDILIVTAGKNVPVDGILISGKGVECDESSMTGESDACKKDVLSECQAKYKTLVEENKEIKDYQMHSVPTPVILSGSQIKNGEGLYLAIAVGDNSCVGKILASLREKPTVTPLQKKLTGIADFIGKIGLYCAIVTVAVLFIRYFASRIIFGGWESSDVGLCFRFLVLGITVLIVAIPEGLPLAVTISLAYSVTKMFDENNLVKTLMSCEVMGNANYVCSDKTGTLTMNQMSIVNIWYGGKDITIDTTKEKEDLTNRINMEGVSLIFESMACNIIKSETGGNATEEACLKLMKKCEFPIDSVQTKYKEINRFFFNSKRKKMSTAIELDSSLHRLYIKGAPEKIIPACKSFHAKFTSTERDAIKAMTDDVRNEIEIQLELYNKQALRTIAVAYRDLRPDECGVKHDELTMTGENKVEEEKLTLICLLGIRDTLRHGVEDAVKLCQGAGIKVIMVTGDNKTTAKTIAENCKIINFPKDQKLPENTVLEGKDFNDALGGLVKFCTKCNEPIDNAVFMKYKNLKMQEEKQKQREEKAAKKAAKENEGAKEQNEEEEGGDDDDEEEAELEKQEQQDECPKCQEKHVVDKVSNIAYFKEKIYPNLCVVARSRPEDKLLLVTALKELGNIVAVTGDGTNDAPALKKADVGFAMGIAGTDIAKLAADIILLDDTFTSIVTAIKWGRNIYDSIQKFLQFQVTVNIVALAVAFVGSCVVSESPLTPLQLIWVNIIMDSLASLALATDPPTIDLLYRKPHSKDESMLSKKMFKHILGQATYMIAVVLIILFAGEYFLPEEEIIVNGIPISFNGHVRTGRVAGYDGEKDDPSLYTKEVKDEVGPSRHFTMLFTTFVFLHIVNEWNCRKLYDELNILAGIQNNMLSLGVRFIETFLQVMISQFGSRLFEIYPDGMTWYQWLICIAFALGTLVIRLILMAFPEDKLGSCGDADDMNPLSAQPGVLQIRRSSMSKNRVSLPRSSIGPSGKKLSGVQ